VTDSIDTFYVIDFDRCLSDTDRLDELFYELVGRYSEVDVANLKHLRNTAESKGGSFDQITELQKSLSPERLNEFFELFITTGMERDLMAYGARDFLIALDEKHSPYGIVSYGHPDWQSVKMKATGLAAVQNMIINHSHKGEVVATWQQSDGRFLIPASLTTTNVPIEVKTVVLLDDKAVAFDKLPKEARGYWVQSMTRSLLPSQKGTIPTNVTVAKGFDQVLAFES
jgi:hypothetical protein